MCWGTASRRHPAEVQVALTRNTATAARIAQDFRMSRRIANKLYVYLQLRVKEKQPKIVSLARLQTDFEACMPRAW